jgi:hypothetical protein
MTSAAHTKASGRPLRRYTRRTIEIRNSGVMDSFACGCCGEALFDHQPLRLSRKQWERHFLAAFSAAPVPVDFSSCTSLTLRPEFLRHS